MQTDAGAACAWSVFGLDTTARITCTVSET